MTDTLQPITARPRRVKQRQQQTWASGDYAVVAARIVLVAEQLCDTADLRAGWRVLDVATGSGNAAIAAARPAAPRSASTTCRPCSSAAAPRAAAEGLTVELLEGDAEALPFADDSFDAVTSVFGSMFAPDHEQAAAELLRVCRPGGTIALASWTPDGFIGDLFRTVARARAAAGRTARRRCSGAPRATSASSSATASPRSRSRSAPSPSGSARRRSSSRSSARWYGPTLKAFAALEGAAREALEQDLVALARRFDRLGHASTPSRSRRPTSRRWQPPADLPLAPQSEGPNGPRFPLTALDRSTHSCSHQP